MSSVESHGHTVPTRGGALGLAVAAVGVVYGDIGTSPLYTLREVFSHGHGIPVTRDNVLGVLSLVFWALMLVVSLKYVVFITRADNRGEGGIMALCSLAGTTSKEPRRLWVMWVLGVFGAALFYGDGMITPAISVLSAVEGLEVAAPALHPYVVPLALVILVGLFLIQRKGTGKVGLVFGPVMVFWFLTLAVLGLLSIGRNPDVLRALNPLYAFQFFADNRLLGFLALGAVVLAVTGGEALYADMGHFGRKPIKLAWFSLVFPCLYLNYLGQGALLLAEPGAAENPFYHLVPDGLLYPMIGLSTLATIIASQAVISGAFSLTKQAVQLGYLPRMHMVYTSEKEMGQIYVPAVNWALLVAVVALVLGFRSSGALASAYGIAVTLTMMIDTLLACVVMLGVWRWGTLRTLLFLTAFLLVDGAFFSATSVKIVAGGWFPLVIGVVVFTLLTTWKRGRSLVNERIKADTIPLSVFIQALFHDPPQRVRGTGVFMTTYPDGVPRALLHNLLHNKVLHDRVVLVNVQFEGVPYVPDEQRVQVEALDFGFYRVVVRYGFKDDTEIPVALQACAAQGLEFEMMETSFFLGRETLVPRLRAAWPRWRQMIFMFMFRNAGSAVDYFHLPPNRVVEMGTQVEL